MFCENETRLVQIICCKYRNTVMFMFTLEWKLICPEVSEILENYKTEFFQIFYWIRRKSKFDQNKLKLTYFKLRNFDIISNMYLPHFLSFSTQKIISSYIHFLIMILSKLRKFNLIEFWKFRSFNFCFWHKFCFNLDLRIIKVLWQMNFLNIFLAKEEI